MDLSNKTIAVTGYKGFIGKHLVKYLEEKFPNAIILKLGKEWKSFLDEPDIVFHLGAFTPKEAALANNIKEINLYNIDYTINLINQLSSKTKIIFASTLDVYAPTSEKITETSKVNPISLYGSSKLYCEQLLKFTHPNSVILRYGNVYGPGEEAYRKLIPETIRTLLREESPVIHGNPNTTRDYIYVEDVVEATIKATQLDNYDIINIVNGYPITVDMVVKSIIWSACKNKDIIYKSSDLPSNSRIFDSSKMHSILGGVSLTPFQVGLIMEIGYFKSLYEIQ